MKSEGQAKMKDKKHFSLIAILLVLTALLVSSAGWACKAPIASFSEATMCRSVDQQTKRPVEKSDVFHTDATVIYCSVKVSNAPPETKATAVWIYIQGEVEDLQNHEFSKYSLMGSGTRYLSFSITQPNNGWPVGDYAVKLLLNDEEQLTVPFKVEAAPIVPDESAYLSEANTCRNVDPETAEPIEKTTVFTADTPVIYCSVKLSDAKPDTEVKAQWLYVTENTVLHEDVSKDNGNGYLAFQLQSPQSGWAFGEYMVRIFLNGQLKFQVHFKVE